MFAALLQNVKERAPIVHTITNFVTVNDCANIILAAGGSPTMAQDIGEVEEITRMCQSLVLNLGAIGCLDAMVKAAQENNRLGHPVVLDPVAAGASTLRNNAVKTLLQNVHVSVIRGNVSEIKALALGTSSVKGVDASYEDLLSAQNLSKTARLAQALSASTQAVVAISGPVDIVADTQNACAIHNGHPMMARITGSGCMLTALIGAFVGANPQNLFNATLAAVGAMGLCGELAAQKVQQEGSGTGSFRTYLWII